MVKWSPVMPRGRPDFGRAAITGEPQSAEHAVLDKETPLAKGQGRSPLSGPDSSENKPATFAPNGVYAHGGVGSIVKLHGTVSGSVATHLPSNTAPVLVNTVTNTRLSKVANVASTTLVGPPTNRQPPTGVGGFIPASLTDKTTTRPLHTAETYLVIP